MLNHKRSVSPISILTSDPVMCLLVEKYKSPQIGKTPVFISLVRAVISQQLSDAAASTIFKKLSEIKKISPNLLLDLSTETIRSCGISTPKAGYIKAISRAALDGFLDNLEALSDKEVVHALTKIKGVGTWTAEMTLIFALGREDVWSCSDAGLIRAAKNLYGVQTSEEFAQLGNRFRPYRSHAAWYLWCSLG